ncbi:MAG: VWA domain-containing protein, partial [Deltaproteobacteria bacterium]|nr:VWA domain-containing protein [Deltaproteobacteria bacterium]
WKTKPSLLPVYPYDGESGPGYPNAAWLEQQKAAWRPVLQRVKSRNALLVLAAGNNSNPTVRMVDAKWSGGPQALADEFPDNVIVVAAVGDPSNHGYFGDWADQWNALSPSSSVGELIDVAAPGGKILSLKPYQAAGDDRVEYMSGTSMAAPFVTGLASLVWSLRPEMTPAQVKERIVLGARRGGPQVYRRLDPAKPEPVQAFPFHVINAGATLRIIDRPAGCTDADGDGYGTREPSGGVGLSCAHAEPDCNDSDAKVYPGAPEICDGKDNDCNGHMDEENVCRGVLAAAPVSGVVPGRFSTSGGEFSVSVSPLDPHGDLIRQGLTTSSFSFRDITVELLASPGQQVATGRATVTGVYVEPGGAAGEPLAVALLFDSSGSMSDSDPQYRRVDAARVLLRQLGPDDQAALLDFGALEGQTPVTRVLSPLTADRQAWEQGLAQVTSVDGTPLYQAVAEALGYLSAQGAGRRVLVVLSDGQSTEDDPDGLRQQAASLASQRQIFVYAVGLGAELDFSGLEALASGTGGTFAFAEDAQVLAGLYEALGVATTAGRVLVHGQGTFTPPLSQPGRHLVHGVLRTSVGSGRVDTPFDFTVLMVQ